MRHMTTEKTEVVSLRLPRGALKRIRHLAHLESVRRNSDLTWSEMVRESVETLLQGQEPKAGER